MQNLPSVPIQTLCAETGLTSRTLRHWEKEGLFESQRDPTSGHRAYTPAAVQKIHITALLRSLELPIPTIRAVLAGQNTALLLAAIGEKQQELAANTEAARELSARLEAFSALIEAQNSGFELALLPALASTTGWERVTRKEKTMKQQEAYTLTLPPMRLATHSAVGITPEDEALAPLLPWLEAAGLMGTARIFGYNVAPMPSGEGQPYGFAYGVTIPEGIPIPALFTELRVPGGLYLALDAGDDPAGAWQKMGEAIKAGGWQYDESRPFFEEHMPKGNASASEMPYRITLLEPICK